MMIRAPQFRLESLQTNPVSVKLQTVFVVGQSDQNEVYYPPDESQEHTDEGDVVGNRLVFGAVHTSSALVIFSHLPLPHQDAKFVAAPRKTEIGTTVSKSLMNPITMYSQWYWDRYHQSKPK